MFVSYSIFIISLILTGLFMNFKIFYFMFLIVPIFQLLKFQIKDLDINKTKDCLRKFKSNNTLGLIIFLNILIGKLI